MQSMQTISQTHEMLQAGVFTDPGGLSGVLGTAVGGLYYEVLKPIGTGLYYGLKYITWGLFAAL